MLHYQFGKTARQCDGLTRRQALRIGSSGLIGGLSLPLLLELEAKAANPNSKKKQGKDHENETGVNADIRLGGPGSRLQPELRDGDRVQRGYAGHGGARQGGDRRAGPAG